MNSPQLSPIIVRAGEGERLELRGETRHQLLSGHETGDALALVRSDFQMGAGWPLHAHTREDEWFCIERGQFEFQIGAEIHTLGAGDTVFAPRGVPHRYSCQSENGGTLLIGVVGADADSFFRELAALDQPDSDQMRDVAAGYGVRFDDFDSLPAPDAAPAIVRPNDGECLEAFGDRVRVLVSSAASAGRFCLAESETPSFLGPPPHVHEREDETFLIRAGRYEFQLGDARVQIGPGDVVFAPRGVPHSFRVVSSEPGEMLIFATPGGFDAFFAECARLFENNTATPEAIGQIGAAHQLKFLAPKS